MTTSISENNKLAIRPLVYRDIEAIEVLAANSGTTDDQSCSVNLSKQLNKLRSWYGILKFLTLFPNPYQHDLCIYVAELDQKILGLIQVEPFNKTRTTWRVKQVLVDHNCQQPDIGSQLLKHCFEKIWEARTWILEVNVNNKSTLALYRQNGFQPLAQMTYWAITPELLAQIAQHEPDLPNLLPVSNADAQLLYQLDTVSMPPLLRQVFDRHIQDFKASFPRAVLTSIKQWLNHQETISGYVFEPQRKAAIGHFELEAYSDRSNPHKAKVNVHPAYTWLYPELFSQLARIVQGLPEQSLQLASADYQPEREEYLEKIGAQRIEHTLLMSRSVWHKLREAKPSSLEGLQLSEVLKGLQPAPRTPIPSRISWLKTINQLTEQKSSDRHNSQKDSSVNSNPKEEQLKANEPPEMS
ncbi:MAG: GNAT family N-acetyltransferase [Spirulinaceae cyanobacterium]